MHDAADSLALLLRVNKARNVVRVGLCIFVVILVLHGMIIGEL